VFLGRKLARQVSKEQLSQWFVKTTKYLNETYVLKMVEPNEIPTWEEWAGVLQNMAGQARNDVKKMRAELATFDVPSDVSTLKTKCTHCLDYWDSFFHYMARWGAYGKVEDFGEASKQHEVLENTVSDILVLLGVKTAEWKNTFKQAETEQEHLGTQQPTREREIIREKEVIVKIRCPYCRGTYDETLDECPHCGAKR